MRAIYSEKECNFSVNISFASLNDKKFAKRIHVLFDTGAMDTILSMSDLFVGNMYTVMKEYCDKLGFETIHIDSPVGGSALGYRICLENVRIGGVLVPQFYCYVVDNLDMSGSVLGEDFISSCRFEHDVGMDILMDLDLGHYNNRFESLTHTRKISRSLFARLSHVDALDEARDIAISFIQGRDECI